MKKIILIALLALGMSGKAQISLETTYPNVSINAMPQNRLDLLPFSTLGFKYFKWDRANYTLELYELNHSLFKVINVPPQNQASFWSIEYISDVLFDIDSTNIEYLIRGVDTNYVDYVKIYNENGTVLFSHDSASVCTWIGGDLNVVRMPIVTTDIGSKMMVDLDNGTTKVYSLPGKLSYMLPVHISTFDNVASPYKMTNPYPNPAINSIHIDYKLPETARYGEIIIFNQAGKQVKKYKVDKTFEYLELSTADLAAGSYSYILQTAEGIIGTKKFIKIK